MENLYLVIKVIKVGKCLILNGDFQEDIAPECLKDCYPITCGLSLRSTVTASSIEEDGFTYCLQRGIVTVDEKEILPQEFNVYWAVKPEDIYPYLAIVTMLLICGVSVDLFKTIVF